MDNVQENTRGLNNLAEEIHNISVEHGWWGDDQVHFKGFEVQRNFAEVLMLIVSEAAEALEEIRNGHAPSEAYYKVTFKPGQGRDIQLGDDHKWYRVKYDPNDFDGSWPPPEREEVSLDDIRATGAEVKPEGVPTEMADIIIRTLDACAAYGIDIEAALKEKIDFNRTRDYRHGGKLC